MLYELCTLFQQRNEIMAENGPTRLCENFNPIHCRARSAFEPVLSSRRVDAGLLLRKSILLAKSNCKPLANEPHIAKLEKFVENFVTEECGVKLSGSLSSNPELILPQASRKRGKNTFTEFQSEALEENFKFRKYLSPSSRKWLADLVGLSKQQVVTWFQNRRAKERKRVGVKLPRHGKKCTLLRSFVNPGLPEPHNPRRWQTLQGLSRQQVVMRFHNI